MNLLSYFGISADVSGFVNIYYNAFLAGGFTLSQIKFCLNIFEL